MFAPFPDDGMPKVEEWEGTMISGIHMAAESMFLFSIYGLQLEARPWMSRPSNC